MMGNYREPIMLPNEHLNSHIDVVTQTQHDYYITPALSPIS